MPCKRKASDVQSEEKDNEPLDRTRNILGRFDSETSESKSANEGGSDGECVDAAHFSCDASLVLQGVTRTSSKLESWCECRNGGRLGLDTQRD